MFIQYLCKDNDYLSEKEKANHPSGNAKTMAFFKFDDQI